MANDIRTQAIILRRTNYGETDRILNFLTPEGKIAALARGVRKEKSRLAGSIELFSVADVVIHQGKSDLGILTSAKMLRFYSNIMQDLSRIELASDFLRRAERAAEQTDSDEYFFLLDQALAGLHQNLNPELVKTWFLLNLVRASGEEINLISDVNGDPLQADVTYFWDNIETALRMDPAGKIGASEIKLTRVILSNKLEAVSRVNRAAEILPALDMIVRAFVPK